MSRKSVVPSIAATVALTLTGLAQMGFCVFAPLLVAQATTGSTKQQHSEVAVEESLPQDAKAREARLAKNMRYNGGRCHLTADQDCFFDITEPWYLPAIPLGKSTVALVGTVSRVQPYLSEDGTRIYTETTFRVEELFKSPANFTLLPDRTMVIDRIGGAVKTRSGQILHDDTRNGFLGRPQVGMRYVLFADSIHEGRDFSMLRGYELRDGKVFRLTEDGSPSKVLLSKTPNKPDSLSDEQEFLQTIRKYDSVDPKTGSLRLTIPTATTR